MILVDRVNRTAVSIAVTFTSACESIECNLEPYCMPSLTKNINVWRCLQTLFGFNSRKRVALLFIPSLAPVELSCTIRTLDNPLRVKSLVEQVVHQGTVVATLIQNNRVRPLPAVNLHEHQPQFQVCDQAVLQRVQHHVAPWPQHVSVPIMVHC